MRLTKTVSLGAGRDAVVSELRVRDVRALLEVLPEGIDAGVETAAVPALLREHLPHLLTLASDCIQPPPGESLDDLSLSETAEITTAWWELHQVFFARLGLAGEPAPVPTDGATPRS